jgi:hypothetical protein
MLVGWILLFYVILMIFYYFGRDLEIRVGRIFHVDEILSF